MAKHLEHFKSQNTSRNAMKTIVLCNRQIYLRVFKLLQIFGTLRVLTTSSERSF